MRHDLDVTAQCMYMYVCMVCGVCATEELGQNPEMPSTAKLVLVKLAQSVRCSLSVREVASWSPVSPMLS